MGLGQGSVVTNQHREPSGAPFSAGSANNGLSVDPGSGAIVLGNNPAEAGNPAQIFSNREILVNAILDFLNPNQPGEVFFEIRPDVGGGNSAVFIGTFDNAGGTRVQIVFAEQAAGVPTMQFQCSGVFDFVGNVIKITNPLPVSATPGNVLLRANINPGIGELKEIQGASGTFTTVDLKTVTVTEGVITSII